MKKIRGAIVSLVKSVFGYIKKYPEETIKLVFYTALLIFCGVMGYRQYDKKYVAEFWVIAQIILFFLVFRIIYRTILRKKLVKVYEKSVFAVRKFLKRINTYTKKFFERFGRKEKGVFIEGKSTYSFLFRKKDKEEKEKSKKQKQKKRKWSDQSTNYDKLRFIYSVTVNKKIREGANIRRSHTPLEIKKAHAENENENELFLCYNDNRYGEFADIDDIKVSIFYETLDIGSKK